MVYILIPSTFNLTSSGTYYTQRCIGDVCSCVDRETSAGIPDTVHTHGVQVIVTMVMSSLLW